MNNRKVTEEANALLRTYCSAWSYKRIMTKDEIEEYAQSVIQKSEAKIEEIQRGIENLKEAMK